MAAQPLVSVIIPALNAAAVVAETLESVRAQTFKDFEVIIVDDGSTDATAAIARRYCETDPRFSLIQQPNQGVSVARNAAIGRARGEWIAFLDADDVWLPEKLARQLELAAADPLANFLFTNFCLWDGKGDLSIWFRDDRPLPSGDVSRKLIFNVSSACAASMSTAMVRREMFHSAGHFDPEFAIAEDWDLLLRMAEHGLWVRGTREPLVRYRRWVGNVTNQRLKAYESNVQVLGKNFRATQRPELRPLYQQSLAFARSVMELARARQMIEVSPDKVPAAVWRAWRFYPRRLKWLMRYVMLVWPKMLGGYATAGIVHRKLVRKF
jgi:teichuronic acid biosynthesis glycosyltransferase TuaG